MRREEEGKFSCHQLEPDQFRKLSACTSAKSQVTSAYLGLIIHLVAFPPDAMSQSFSSRWLVVCAQELAPTLLTRTTTLCLHSQLPCWQDGFCGGWTAHNSNANEHRGRGGKAPCRVGLISTSRIHLSSVFALCLANLQPCLSGQSRRRRRPFYSTVTRTCPDSLVHSNRAKRMSPQTDTKFAPFSSLQSSSLVQLSPLVVSEHSCHYLPAFTTLHWTQTALTYTSSAKWKS